VILGLFPGLILQLVHGTVDSVLGPVQSATSIHLGFLQ
jgi:hypothetical protein